MGLAGACPSMAGAEDVGDINGTFGKAENIEGVNVVKGIEETVGEKVSDRGIRRRARRNYTSTPAPKGGH